MIDLIQTFGLPTGLLLIVLTAVGITMRWAAKAIVQPAVAAHLELVAHLQNYLSTDSETKARLVSVVESVQQESASAHLEIIQRLRPRGGGA